MSLVRYEPFNFLNRFQHSLHSQDLLNPFLAETGESTEAKTSQWRPAVDIKEEDKRYIIFADLPGVDSKEIDITMEDGVLTLQGKRQASITEDKQAYRRLERSHGTFLRRFSLPDTVDVDNIEARGKEGVLEIIIPKQEKLQPRKINIQN